MKVIFIRHGKDDDRYRGGWSELDLVPQGVEQAKTLAKFIKVNNQTYNIAEIISSDLPRAISTANLISAELGIDVQKEFRLREINNGDLAGMLNDVAIVKYPGLFFSSLKMDESYPSGESPNDFFIRIKMWFSDFIYKYRNTNKNVIVVTHGGVINVIYHLVNEIEWTNKGHVFKTTNCSVHVLDSDTMKFEVENRTDFLME